MTLLVGSQKSLRQVITTVFHLSIPKPLRRRPMGVVKRGKDPPDP